MATTGGASDVAANLEAALSETEDSPTAETGQSTETADSPESKRGVTKAIPYSRFKEVIEDKNTLKNELDGLRERFNEQTSSLSKITQMLEQAKQDSDLVKDIKDLQGDPKMLPHLEAIDRKLRGIEEDLEETGTVDKNKVTDVQKLIQKQQDKLDEKFAVQQSDFLIQRADVIADKWLESLPEDYTDQDRKVISKLWANEVNWDILENQPTKLQDHLRDTFKTVIDEFGIPRGKLINPDDPDSYEVEILEPETLSPEQELLKAIGSKNYGKIIEKDKGGKKVRAAEVSDDEFASDMARVLRGNRR